MYHTYILLHGILYFSISFLLIHRYYQYDNHQSIIVIRYIRIYVGGKSSMSRLATIAVQGLGSID